MKTYTATGVTLQARKFRGSQRVLVFYTGEHGKLEAAATGIGKPGSALAGAAELFTVSRLLLAEAKGLDRLSQAEVVESFPRLSTDLLAYGYAAWMAELTARATEPGETCFPLFERLCESLRALHEGLPGPLVAAGYALALLEALGLSPALDDCVTCGEQLGQVSWYQEAAGGLLCESCRQAAPGALRLDGGARGLCHGLRRLPPEQLAVLRYTPAAAVSLLTLLRRHIAYHLGFHLKSEEYLRQFEVPGSS
jgi:DNA repair protein RecO (recombination protein O)